MIIIESKPSSAQMQFFQKLLDEKDFKEQNLASLLEQFSGLNQKSASAWIQAAMELPKRDESAEPLVPPPFVA